MKRTWHDVQYHRDHPRRSALSFGVAVKVTHREGARGSNLAQKGFHQPGGQSKLQLTPSGAQLRDLRERRPGPSDGG
jgi:hypothetical protein